MVGLSETLAKMLVQRIFQHLQRATLPLYLVDVLAPQTRKWRRYPPEAIFEEVLVKDIVKCISLEHSESGGRCAYYKRVTKNNM